MSFFFLHRNFFSRNRVITTSGKGITYQYPFYSQNSPLERSVFFNGLQRKNRTRRIIFARRITFCRGKIFTIKPDGCNHYPFHDPLPLYIFYEDFPDGSARSLFHGNLYLLRCFLLLQQYPVRI